MALLDLSGEIIDCNESACKILGLSRQELLGKSPQDPNWLCQKEDGSLWPEEAHAAVVALQTGEPVIGQVRGVQKRDGTTTWIQLNATPYRDPSTGALRGVAVSFADITEQRNLWHCLQQSESHLRSILDSAPVMLWRTDAKGECDYASRGWNRLLGDDYDFSKTADWKQLVHPDDLPHMEKVYRDAVRNQQPFTMEFRIKGADGEYRTLFDQGVPLTGVNSSCEGFIGVSTDITGMRRAEVERDKANSLSDRILQMLPAIITVRDVQCKDFVFVNTQAAQTFQQSCDNLAEWADASLARLAHPDDLEKVQATIARLSHLKEGELAEVTYRLRAPDGGWRWVISRGMALMRDEQGKISHTVGVTFDIDDRVRAEAALEERKRFLQQLTELLPAMVTVRHVKSQEYRYVNSAVREMLGMDESELISIGGRFFTDHIHEDDRPAVMEIVRQLESMRPDSARQLEIVYRGRGRTPDWRWVHSRTRIIEWNADGTPELIMAVMWDVSDQKAAQENSLRHSELMNELARLLPAWLVVRDVQNGTFEWSNDYLVRLVGHDLSALNTMGNQLIDLIHPEDRVTFERAGLRARSATDDMVVECEYRVRDTAGDWRWTHTRLRPFRRAADGSVTHTVSLSFLIDDRRRLETESAQRQQFLDRLIGILPAMVIIFDLTTSRFVFVSPHMQAAYGVSDDTLNESNDHPIARHVHPDDLSGMQQFITEVAALPMGSWRDFDYRSRQADGSWIWLTTRATPFQLDPAGFATQLLGITYDISHLKETEQALRAKQAFSDRLTSLMPAIISLNRAADGSCLFVGGIIESILGYTPEQITSGEIRLFPESVHEEDRDRVMQAFVAASSLAEGESIETTYRMVDRFGQWHWLSTRTIPFRRDSNGLLEQTMSLTADITPLKTSMLQLEREQRFAQGILSASPAMVAVREDPSGKLTFVNADRVRQLLHAPDADDETLARLWDSVVHPDASKLAKLLSEELPDLSDDQQITCEGHLQTETGSQHWFALQMVPFLRNGSGTVTQCICMMWDVTKQKELEVNLLSTVHDLQLLSRAIDQASSMICVVAADGQLRFTNERFRMKFQLAADDDRIAASEIFSRAGIDSTLFATFGEASAEGQVWTGSLRLHNDHGRECVCRISRSRISPADGSAPFLLLVIDDMTAEADSQRRLMENDKLQAVGMLAAGVAHEFKNYLGGIIGNASLAIEDLEQKPADDPTRETLQQIITMGEQANRVAMSLLSYSRGYDRERTSEQLEPIVLSTVALVEKELLHRSIELLTWFEPDLPPVIVAASKIQQLLLNLILNADHAIGSHGGVISLTATSTGDTVVLKVADTGCGIKPEHLPRVFDPFFSTKGVWGKDKVVGTGMGLSIARNIMREHEGEIAVASIVGAGTTFTMTFPVPSGRSQVRTALEQTAQIVIFSQQTGLFSAYYRQACQNNSDIHVVKSLEAASALLRGRIDLMLLDALFPAKVELMHLLATCATREVPCAIINADQLDPAAFLTSGLTVQRFDGTPSLKEIASELAITFADYV